MRRLYYEGFKPRKNDRGKKMNKFTIFLLTALLIITSCKQKDISNLILAEFKGGKIAVADFERSIIETKYNGDLEKAYLSSFEDRRSHLRDMVYRELIYDLAEKNSIDTIKTVKEEFTKKLYSQAIVNGFVIDSISSKIYSNDEVRKTFEQKKIKYFPKHILIDISKHKDAPAKAKIDSVYLKLKNGEKFEDLAKTYSDDIKTGVSGGELGWVFCYEMVKEFEDQVLKMKDGEYSEPFKSQYGYHILYLSSSKKNEALKSFEKEEAAIRNDLNKKYSVKFNETVLKLIEDLMVRYEVKIDSANIKQFIKQTKNYEEKAKNDDKADPLDHFTDLEKKALFSEYDGIRIDANKVIAALKTFPKDKRPELDGYNDIRMFIIEKIRNNLLERRVDELGYTKKKTFIEAAKSSMYGSYREKIIQKYVKSNIAEPSEEELKKYYEENMEVFKNDDGSYKEFIKVKASISNSIKGKKFTTSLKEWENGTFNDYGVRINYSLLEDTFQKVGDDKK